ncbi:NAD(P)/FAD-dependent oxidoreductase [Tahibacter harae]|uniref:FAD-binding oxidoreductase n=1 Tax=Tahibacter harae TaxID=2963937 RepID=A0ABT1QS18_9GAMM|nr:FAD-dependent oxidoreductase [Tahibacter harae]MCQ4165069.1 FAD-binding oxidoreductase [Tahibacter harae]
MDLKSGYPFWAVKNGLLRTFPRLEQDLRCDIAVIGGGITGALIAHEFAAHDHEVIVLDGRDIAWGSTAASTALLQYEIDTHLLDLAQRYGEPAAALAYRSCAAGVEQIGELARQFGGFGFAQMKSLYYASTDDAAAGLRAEYEARRRLGLDVRWLRKSAIAAHYGLFAAGAILSRPAARFDPYRATHRLLGRLKGRVYARTRVERMEPGRRSVLLHTARGVLRAGHVVVAGGYESQGWLSARVARNRSSYAFATEPMARAQLGPLRDTLVWETARPYIYLRSSDDGRLLVGGEDDAIDIPARRDARLTRKTGTLLRKAALLFPQIPFEPAYSWAGTFAETRDGLPYFGAHEETGPRVLYAMAYGGNGITYSVLGAGLLRATVERRRHALAGLFGFGRHAG